MPKFKGSDGFIYDIDESGTVRSKEPISPLDAPIKTQVMPGVESEITPREVLQTAVKAARPFVTGLATLARGGAATGMGADLGMQGIQAALGDREPSILGSFAGVENPYLDAIIGAGENVAGIGITDRIFRKVTGSGLAALERKFKGGGETATERLYRENPDLELPLSDLTESHVPKFVEEMFGMFSRGKAYKRATTSLQTAEGRLLAKTLNNPNLDPADPTFDYAVLGSFRGSLLKMRDSLRRESQWRAATVNDFAEKIKGGIKPNRLGNQLNEYLTDKGIDIQGLDPQELMKTVEDADKPLVRFATDILKYAKQYTSGPNKGKFILDDQGSVMMNEMPFNVAWQFQKDFGEVAFSGARKEVVAENRDRIVRGWWKELSDDMEDGIQGWKAPKYRSSSAEVDLMHKFWRQSKGLTQSRHRLLQQGDEITKIIVSPEKIMPNFKAIANDPVKMRRAIQAGDRATVQTAFLNDLFDKGWSEGKDSFSKPNLLSYWHAPSKAPIKKMLFTKEELGQVDRLVNVMAKSDKTTMGEIPYAILMRGGTASAVLGTGLLAGNLSGAGPYAGVTGAIIGMYGISRLMLNPKTAKLMAVARELPKDSPALKIIGKQMFGALKGTKIILTYDDGEQRPAQINNQGQLIVE